MITFFLQEKLNNFFNKMPHELKLVLLLFFFINQAVLSQNTASVGVSVTLPAIAILDIEPNNSALSLNLLGLTEAGNAATVAPTATDNSKWLNFTSAVARGASRSISAQISGTLGGVKIKLVTANYVGTGAGALGNRISPIYLSNAPQTVVTNIGGAYTGNGQGNGYNLTYSIEIADYGALRTQTNTVSIIYTLTDN